MKGGQLGIVEEAGWEWGYSSWFNNAPFGMTIL